MTPAARVAAAITILDTHLAGRSAEQALSGWARASRFAGSKDRAAIRDLVFDALRRRSSCAAIGGGLTGRGLMLGLGVQHGWELHAIFSGEGHAPAPLTEAEQAHIATPPVLSAAEKADMPAWLWPLWQRDLADQAATTAAALRERAGMFLRVNRQRGSGAEAAARLAAEDITTEPHSEVAGCLIVTSNARRVQLTQAYQTGLVEVQDASSQAAVAALDIPATARVLDYCAGGGGKALAVADRFGCAVTAHDAAPARMKDIGPRAARAGVKIAVTSSEDLQRQAAFDVVIVDAPCSGSGTWRRNPEAKWAFTENKLAEFAALQLDVLQNAKTYLRPGGQLIYMTCSVFADENLHVVHKFCGSGAARPTGAPLVLVPSPLYDGFFCQSLSPI